MDSIINAKKYASNFKTAYGIGGGYYYNESDLFESSSCAGSKAFNWTDIIQYHNQFSDNHSPIDYLPTSAYLNLNVFEIYMYINSLSKNFPREFLKQPIDRNLGHGDYFNVDQSLGKIIYGDILPARDGMFSQCTMKNEYV